MSEEKHTHSPDDAASSGEIHTEASPFELGYQPNTLPKISVPELPDDAPGISAEALAQVPTLVDEVDPASPIAEPEAPELPPVEDAPEVSVETEPATLIQDPPAQADTWTQELQVRMGKLNDEIHTLNARLDRLEETIKLKV